MSGSRRLGRRRLDPEGNSDAHSTAWPRSLRFLTTTLANEGVFEHHLGLRDELFHQPCCSPARPPIGRLASPTYGTVGGKDATTHILMRRLLSLDYLIERPTLGWLPTEADKVQRFEALGTSPSNCRSRSTSRRRRLSTVDAGQSTDSELRAWGMAHAPLWAALRARTFAVHIVAVGTGIEAANRAAPVLTHWTQDGDGQGVADPAGPTQADPDIRQEIAWLKTALTTGNRQMLREWSTFEKAADRILYLEALPAGTPTRTTVRGAIDRFTIWPTIRLTTPEVAI